MRAGEYTRNAYRYARASGDRRRGDAEYCPAILRSVFPGRLLGRILGLHALLIASSSAIGPVLGGTILHTLSWQWLFAINVVPGTLALLLAVKALPRDAVRKQAPFDTPGAILSALLLGSTIMAANSLGTIIPVAFAGQCSLR